MEPIREKPISKRQGRFDGEEDVVDSRQGVRDGKLEL